MTIVATARLRIRDQNELLNQIAGTYKDFFRAAMEYVDNAIDAASILRQEGDKHEAILRVHIDSAGRRLSFTDNCAGMSPEELCDLLSEVGRSKKKAVPWANGQFGFGVHAFRAFAREALFVSRKRGCPESRIKINRSFDETVEVPCESTEERLLQAYGTRVVISHFDPQVFKKSIFLKAIVSEIENHFDDVLRSGLIKIIVTEDSSREYECKWFDFSSLPGVPIKKRAPIPIGGTVGSIDVDLKILDRAQDNRLAVLTNKQRRVTHMADLKSYKTFARDQGESTYVWSNPFVVGSVEINDLCSPNLTRDDLRDSPNREGLYEQILLIQKELQTLVDETMNRKTQEAYKKLGSVMSDCLARILKSFRLQFQQMAPTTVPGQEPRRMVEETGDQPFGGNEAGGGGEGPNETVSGGQHSEAGMSGVGSGDSGGGEGGRSRGTGAGQSTPQLTTSSGPRIEFQNHAGEDRVIDLGNSLIVNTQHPDFIARNPSRSGAIKLDARLLGYVSLVIAPPCVHRLFERRGKVPTALEAGTNIVDLVTRLEKELVASVLGQEIEIAK